MNQNDNKQKEIDELAYFKAIYHSLIDGAARDTEKINKLQAEIDELKILYVDSKRINQALEFKLAVAVEALDHYANGKE